MSISCVFCYVTDVRDKCIRIDDGRWIAGKRESFEGLCVGSKARLTVMTTVDRNNHIKQFHWCLFSKTVPSINYTESNSVRRKIGLPKRKAA